MKSISIGEIPTFMKVDYLSPQDCIIQGYRTRRVPISSVLDLVNDHGEYEMDAYHYGYSANGRYIRYSHIIRIDQEREGTCRYQFADLNQSLSEHPFEKLYDALWSGPFNESHANIKMMEDVHLAMDEILTYPKRMDAVEVDQFGRLLKRFDLKENGSQSFEIFEKEREYISWIELPVFSVYISELPPE